MLFTHSMIRKRPNAACASVLGETRRLQGERARFTSPPPPMLLQDPLDRYSANANCLIIIITHAHVRTGRTRRIHSIYSERDERFLRRLYQYLQF